MPYGIETVTVIGAGTMGAAIAGHLANAGIRAWLLDIVPSELTAEETAAGLTPATPYTVPGQGSGSGPPPAVGFGGPTLAPTPTRPAAQSADILRLAIAPPVP